MNTFKTTYDDPALRGDAIAHDRARALLGQVMGYVAVTVGFTALGANLGRDLSGATWLMLFVATIPLVLWQAAGGTAAFVAAFGAYGYATRRDLSSLARPLFRALLGLIVFGIVANFALIPDENIGYAAGLGFFGVFTIFDINWLRRSAPDAAVPIAAGIFLDLFGGRRD